MLDVHPPHHPTHSWQDFFIHIATIVIGLFMGRSALRGEKERQLNMRRGQARQAHRKYTDEVSFVVGKDSRDTLRRTQRRMRDFFAARAEELHRSTTTALAAAQQAVKSDASTRQKRLRDVEAELKRIADAAALAAKNGIEPHAGHGLTFDNVVPVAAIPQLAELNIGHFLVGEAIFTGLDDSVRRMRALMDEAR